MAREVILPQLGLAMEEGTIVKWLKGEGDQVEEGEPIVEIMTDKANVEVPAPASGVLVKILVPEGQAVPVGVPIAYIGQPGEEVPVLQATSARPAPVVPRAGKEKEETAREPERKVQASPRARRLAEEHGIDLWTITGTGPGGRIVEEDVRRAIDRKRAEAPVVREKGIEGTLIPVVGMRGAIARRMMESIHGSAQVTLATEADATELVRLRKRIGPELERQHGVHLTYTDLLVKAVARALTEHPRLNARWEGEAIRILPEIHIGVAVALEDGLVVPVIRNADRLGIVEISRAVALLSEKARAGRLTYEEMTGSTFTITNLGMYDIDMFTPIINPPEAAILGVGRIVEKPVIVEGRVEARFLMTLSLTFDHRIVDGAPAARFLQRVKELVENPYPLIL
ncbi:MAG: dihydrolipoamide acetyltransferase family protein [Armatimonadota bacterium]|nr:dihydrolipoamide acetyltransferase family protein [Armatimonadota bacterium]MDR5702915.1 dihydrolipoamide acetyltransferase family protein [Armatimonadota bacterium]